MFAVDITPPVFSNCPKNIKQTIPFEHTVTPVWWGIPSASDNSGIAVTVRNVSGHPGKQFAIGTTTVNYTATDSAGNVGVCSFNITITQEGKRWFREKNKLGDKNQLTRLTV